MAKLMAATVAKDLEQTPTCYIAINTDAVNAQWSIDDKILFYEVRDLAAPGSPVVNTYMFNTNTNATIVIGQEPAVGKDLVPCPGVVRMAIGSENLPFAAVAAGVPFAAVAAGANLAEVHVWQNDVCITFDGTAPNPATFTGYIQQKGHTFELESADEIAKFLAIEAGTGAAGSLWATYFNTGRQNS